MKSGKIFIYGKHAVEEALRHAPHALTRIYTDSRGADRELQKLISAARVPTAPLSQGLARSDMRSGAPHQGLVGQVSSSALVEPYARFAERLAPGPDTALVLLAGVQDPHNVGALVRSAAGLGAQAVLLTAHAQAGVTAAVIKASAGMAFKIPLVEVSNLQQCLSDLKKRGFALWGLAGEGATPLPEAHFDRPAVFIVGNEAEGLPAHVRDVCDGLLSIPMHPRCESLNVAAAGAAALYAWSVQHKGALRAV